VDVHTLSKAAKTRHEELSVDQMTMAVLAAVAEGFSLPGAGPLLGAKYG